MIYTIIVGETLTALADNVNQYLSAEKNGAPVGAPFANTEDGGWAQAIYVDSMRATARAAIKAATKGLSVDWPDQN